MAKLVTFVVAAAVGAVLGAVGLVAAVGALSPSADHVANQTRTDPVSAIYGTR
jgi:type III secretory pathway component EscU